MRSRRESEGRVALGEGSVGERRKVGINISPFCADSRSLRHTTTQWESWGKEPTHILQYIALIYSEKRDCCWTVCRWKWSFPNCIPMCSPSHCFFTKSIQTLSVEGESINWKRKKISLKTYLSVSAELKMFKIEVSTTHLHQSTWWFLMFWANSTKYGAPLRPTFTGFVRLLLVMSLLEYQNKSILLYFSWISYY